MAPPSKQQRRSARGSSSLWDLARHIQEGKKVVFITGAGLSVASGIRAFRTTNESSNSYSNDGAWKSPTSRGANAAHGKQGKQRDKAMVAEAKKGLIEEQPLGIWNSTLWTQAKRETFRKDQLLWWNDFWLEFFPTKDYENKYRPNQGHLTLAALQRHFPDSVRIITQNVDGLQHSALDWEEADKATSENLKNNIIEAHGRLGLYKCIPAEDSDTDSSSDEDDDRLVHLGHRRKHSAWKQKHLVEARTRTKKIVKAKPKNSDPPGNRDPPGRRQHNQRASTRSSNGGCRRVRPSVPLARQRLDPPSSTDDEDATVSAVSTDVSSGSSMSDRVTSCKYQMVESLTVDQLEPPCVRPVLQPPKRLTQIPRAAAMNHGDNDCDEQAEDRVCRRLTTPPLCPTCGNKVLPQALLFDEGYHSHDHYNFTKMEDWLEEAEVLVFVGTSFAVTLPLVALDHARDTGIPVFNFNVSDMLDSSRRLNVENIAGPSQQTLPKLLQAIQYLEDE